MSLDHLSGWFFQERSVQVVWKSSHPLCRHCEKHFDFRAVYLYWTNRDWNMLGSFCFFLVNGTFHTWWCEHVMWWLCVGVWSEEQIYCYRILKSSEQLFFFQILLLCENLSYGRGSRVTILCKSCCSLLSFLRFLKQDVLPMEYFGMEEAA